MKDLLFSHGLVDEQSLADLLDVSTRTIQGWRREHKGPPYIRLGKLIKYDLSDVLPWIKSMKRIPDAGKRAARLAHGRKVKFERAYGKDLAVSAKLSYELNKKLKQEERKNDKIKW